MPEVIQDNSFKIVFTVSPDNINWDIQFRQVIDHAVVDLLLKEAKILENLHKSQPVDGMLKNSMNNYLWSFIRNHGLDCVGIEWK